MKNARYFFSIIPGILVIIGNLMGGFYSIMNIIYSMIGLVLFDWLLKENKEEPSAKENDLLPDFILILSVLVHTAGIFSLLFGIYTHALTGKFIWLAGLSTGINAGISGIVSAHEMIHRKQAWWRALGIWNLIFVNYGHFFVEHVKGHHRWVGTEKDPATARYGENIYAFFVRTIPGQFLSAFKIEASRLEKEGKNKYGFNNFVVRVTAVQFLICGFIYAFFGTTIFMAYLHQSLIAVLLLEYVNYIEHYGLVRSENEKYNATHAWQSDITTSRFSLIELSRHSDHHLKASKPYQTLATHESSPVLPSGYFGVFYFVLIPPLWFKLVHPILEKK